MLEVLRPSVAANYVLPPEIPQNIKSEYAGKVISPHNLPEHLFKSAPAFFSPLFRFAARAFEQVTKVAFPYPDGSGVERTIDANVSIISRPKFAALAPVAITDEQDIATIKKILPSVVRVYAENPAKDEAWYGSGVIVEPNDIISGYNGQRNEYFILTNHHVANEAEFLSLKLPNGIEVMGEVVKAPSGTPMMDEEMDIAIVRFFSPMPLPCARIGEPSELQTGQKIFTAGHPLALPNVAVTKGIISNPQQETGSLSLDIQSDAPISPGNSGGPAFNENGEVVGLNTYTFRSGEDMSFTKPVDLQLNALDEIWEEGKITRGTLNFTVEAFPLIDRIQAGFPREITGAIVSDITKGSAAALAGLKSGDIITSLTVLAPDGNSLETLNLDIHDYFEAEGVIKRWVADLVPGTTVHALVYRKEGENWIITDVTFPVEEAK